MRRSILKEHKDYFHKYGFIEFADLISAKVLDQFRASVDDILVQRLEISQKDLAKESPSRLFAAGRDLWRAHPAARSVVTQGVLAEIAAILLGQSCLRLGYDQFLEYPRSPSYLPATEKMQVWQHSYTLPQLSSIEGMAGGWIICLQDGNEETEALSVLPKTIGSGVVFSSSVAIPFQQLKEISNHRYLLIAYTKERAFYINNPEDPNVNSLRKVGYRFGQLLVDKWNPIVYRSSAHGMVHP